MARALLISIIPALISVPIWAARDPHPSRGLRKAVIGVLAYVSLYVLAVTHLEAGV